MSTTRVKEALHAEGIRKMTLPERQAIEKDLRDLTAQLNGTASEVGADGKATEQARPDLLQNRPALLARKKKLEDILTKDDDLVARGDTQRSALAREAREIESRVKTSMLTSREKAYRMGQRPQDFEIAVQKTVTQQQEHLVDLQRWQEIMRQLFPDDPTMCDVKRIKPA